MGVLLAILTVALILICTCLFLLRLGFPVRLPPAAIERGVAVKLPMKRPLKRIGQIEVTSVRLDTSGQGDRLSVGVDVTVTGLPAIGPIAGQTLVSAGMWWDDAAGELFLRETRIESLSVRGLPDSVLSLVSDAATVAVRELLEGRPVWRLEPKTKALAACRALIRDVRVRKGALELGVGGSAGVFSKVTTALLRRE